MFFYLHYMLMTSGLSGTSVLLGVFFKTYSDASQGEIGALLMSFPFVGLVIKPLFCSMADRHQAHRLYMVISIIVEITGFAPFAIIPFFPSLFEQHPRVTWYLLAIACHVGNAGLGVAWSLGDCLAMNMSQKNGTPFGRMRLMGTVAWGVYGFIIGQINEVSFLPKYLPAFLILHLSLIVELILICVWKDEDFVLVDTIRELPPSIQLSRAESISNVIAPWDEARAAHKMNLVDSTPSSLGGTLRLNAQTAAAFKDVLAADDLHKRLKTLEASQAHLQQQQHQQQLALQACLTSTANHNNHSANNSNSNINKALEDNLAATDRELGATESPTTMMTGGRTKRRNPQLLLLKMILVHDGRVIKYTVLFTIFGIFIASINFLFMSYEGLCHEKGYNFSQLAGAVLISQAAMETLGFLVVPWVLTYISRSATLALGLLMMAVRFFFYAGWFYTSDISPYWSVVGEWGHGIPYGIFCTIQADVALMFASESALFIPELRKLGYLSDVNDKPKQVIEAEEKAIKLALRATISALFGGFMDGLGQGLGALLCGAFAELYSYIFLWQVFFALAAGTMVVHQIVELTKTRWSDRHRPLKGTKAYEIMQLTGGGSGGKGTRRRTQNNVVRATLTNQPAQLQPTSLVVAGQPQLEPISELDTNQLHQQQQKSPTAYPRITEDC